MENFEEKLIEFIRDYEVIYNKRSSGYKNVAMKTKIWNEIAQKLESTVEECLRRWKSLRDRYTQELRKKELPSGSAAPTTQSWHLFDTMNFLHEHVAPRRIHGNMSFSTNDDSVMLVENNSNEGQFSDSQSDIPQTSSAAMSTPLTPHSKRRKPQLEEINKSFVDAISSFKDYINNKQSTKPTVMTEDERFAQTVLNMILMLEEGRKNKAKVEIIKYLAEENAAQYE